MPWLMPAMLRAGDAVSGRPGASRSLLLPRGSSHSGQRNTCHEAQCCAHNSTSLHCAGKLLETVQEAERELQPWMPAGRLHQLTARRQQLGELLRQLQSGQLGTLGEPVGIVCMCAGTWMCSKASKRQSGCDQLQAG